MSLVKYNNFNLTFKDNKFILKEVLDMFNYEKVDENILVSKKQLIKGLNKENDEEKKFIDFLKNDFIEPMMDIYTFMKKKKFIISENEVFNELWSLLQNKKEILITPILLNFMYKTDKENNVEISHEVFHQRKRDFIKFLKENNIDYEEIDYQNEKCQNYEYIINDIKNSDKKNLHLKKYILLSIRNFKIVAMIKSDIFMDYYLNFEEIYYAYLDYTREYEIKLNEFTYKKELENKKKELALLENEIKEKTRINDSIQNFINNIKKKNKNGYIYIATSKYYASLNMFKVGLITNLNNNLNSHNSNITEYNRIYYCFFEKVYNVNKVENIINDLLEDFKDKDSKEMYIIHYTYLEELIKLLIQNVKKPHEYINNMIKNKLTDMYNLKPIIPKKIIINEEEN